MSEILDVLDALGIEQTGSRGGDEVQALCPMHEERTGKADHSPSWWINAESGLSTCFSCGYSASLEKLVADVLGLQTKWGTPDYFAAEEWLSNYRDGLVLAHKKTEKRASWSAGLAKPVAMTEARLAVFTEPPEWALEARQLTAEACRAYGVLWDEKKQAWITPLRDPSTSALMGWQLKGQGNRLFRNLPAGVEKTRTLFGIDSFSGPTMIVVESPLDCVRLLSAGVTGAVSTCGAKISDEQIRLISRAHRIILALDNDEAGHSSLESFYKESVKRGIDFFQFAYQGSSAKDPGDMTDDEIHAGLANKIHCIYGLDALKNA